MKKKILIAAGILVVLFVTLLVVLHTGPVKRTIANAAESYLLKNYDIKLELGSLDYTLRSPLKILASDVKLYGGDQNKGVFLTSKKLRTYHPGLFLLE